MGCGETFVVVGFKVDSEKSVYYKKCRSGEELKEAVWMAFCAKGCDFVSVRRVRPATSRSSSG